MCICWGQVTDVVISSFRSPFSTACNSHAEGERAWKRCTAAHHWWRSLFSPSLWLTITRTAVFAAPLLYLCNDQLPRRVSHCPQCDLRRQEGMERMVTSAVLSDVPHRSLGERLNESESKESNRDSSASNTGIMFSSLRKPHIYSVMCSLKGSPPVVYQITPGSLGFGRKSHRTIHAPVTFGQDDSIG